MNMTDREGRRGVPRAGVGSPVVLALDVPTLREAEEWAERFSGRIGMLKVGPALFALGGLVLIRRLRDRGAPVFLDLKLHDIPNTVAGAVRVFASEGVSALTLHAAGGRRMLEGASEEVRRSGSPLCLLGVTVLTSLSPEEQEEADPGCVLDEALRARARLCEETGLGGVVCSVPDLPRVRPLIPGRLAVVPGIRSREEATQDQRRTGTPGEARRAGADRIVVGRSLLGAADPLGRLEAIHREWEEAGE
jgi:orotidine-5'-phosphate decarboxylase